MSNQFYHLKQNIFLTISTQHSKHRTHGQIDLTTRTRFAEQFPVCVSDVPPDEFRASNFVFTDSEEFREKIRGEVRFNTLCPFSVTITSWNLYITDSFIAADLETGLLDSGLYVDEVSVGRPEADGGKLGLLIARIPQGEVATNCLSQDFTVTIPDTTDPTSDLISLLDPNGAVRIPPNRRYFLVLAVNDNGEARVGTFTQIDDRASPGGIIRGLVFIDEDLAAGKISGAGTITR